MTHLRVLVVLAAVACARLIAAPGRQPPAGIPWLCHVNDGAGVGADGTKLADINGDGALDVTTRWEEDDSTRVYMNPGPAGGHLFKYDIYR